MKIITLITALLLTSQVLARHDKGDTYACKGEALDGETIVLKQTAERGFYKHAEKKCGKHSKIQFEWEAYTYYTLTIGDKVLSGVGCEEDVNFEFRSSNRFEGERVSLFMYMDELFDSKLTIGDKEYYVDCDYL